MIPSTPRRTLDARRQYTVTFFKILFLDYWTYIQLLSKRSFSLCLDCDLVALLEDDSGMEVTLGFGSKLF